MKKIVSFLVISLLTLAASARVVVFDATEDNGVITDNAAPFIIDKDGVTLNFSNGLANGTQWRLYKNQTLTICAEDGNITRIEFYCTAAGDAQYGPGGLTCNTGEYSYEELVGIWTGCSQCVTFTAATSQVRFTKIVVTVEDSGLRAPIIKPASGTYYEPIEVSITCSTTDATIHYTTDGSDPTISSAQYTAPFTLNAYTTVKAISAKDGEISDVVSAEYAFETPTELQSLWESLTVPDGTVTRFNNPVITLAQHNRYLYVMDRSGYALFYGDCGQTYNNGDVIPAGFVGTMATYNCERELKDLSGFQPASDNVPVEPELITIPQVGHETFGHYVVLREVKIFQMDEGGYTLVDMDGNECPVYFGTLGITPPGDLSAKYDIIAIVGSYKPKDQDCVYQLLPIKYTKIGPSTTICELYSVEDGTIIDIDLETQVVYQSGSYLYFKQGEECYGLIYGNTQQTYQPGDIIPPGWSGMKTTYSGEPEITSPLTGLQPASRNEPLIPDLCTPLDVNHAFWAHFVEMRNVYISNVNGSTFTITDENGNSCIGFSQFFFGTIQEGFYPLIQGIICSYKPYNSEVIYELAVTYLGTTPPSPVRCLNELYELPEGQAAKIQLIAIYQNGVNLYVKDMCDNYGLIYGNVGISVVNGDIIEGTASWKLYGDFKELIPGNDWTIIGHGEPVEPYQISIEEISQDMVHWYLAFDDVTVDESTGAISDGTGELPTFDKFHPEIIDMGQACPPDMNDDGEVNIADLNCLIDFILSGKIDYDWTWTQQDDGEMKWNVSGFLGVFNNLLELYPVEITRAGGTSHIIGDLNFDGELNIADVNELIDKIIAND